MGRSIDQFRKGGAYLPAEFRDFHDQKDLFKLIHETINVDNHDYAKGITWVAGHCYVIDIFLWAMARYGYTLQKSRADVSFRCFGDDIKKMQNSETRILASMLSHNKEPTPNDR